MRLKDIPIGSIISSDTDSIWKFKYGDEYTGETVREEPVKWVVAEHNFDGTGGSLVVSKELLFKHRYHDSSGSVAWSGSLLQSFLNGVFYSHFSHDMRKTFIPHQDYRSDYVFILSGEEHESIEYLTDSTRVCQLNGVNSRYYTRERGGSSYIPVVEATGHINLRADGNHIFTQQLGNRPSLIINSETSFMRDSENIYRLFVPTKKHLIKSYNKIQSLSKNNEWVDTGLTEPLTQVDFEQHGIEDLGAVPKEKWQELDDGFEVITWTDEESVEFEDVIHSSTKETLGEGFLFEAAIDTERDIVKLGSVDIK